MTDDTKAKTYPVSDPHRVPISFVNQLVGSGHLNGVVNLTFAAAMFTPPEVGDTASPIPPDLVITSRLRMDFVCAQQVYEQLGRMLAQALKQQNATSH